MDFSGLIPIQEATGENLFNLLNDEIQRCDQSLKNSIYFASDGASNMFGCNNSVWTTMREVSPFYLQLKCICHSLALCIQYAVAKLQFSIGFFLLEIPMWFRHSNIIKETYKDLFKVMNSSTASQQIRNVPLPFEKTSATGWLYVGKLCITF